MGLLLCFNNIILFQNTQDIHNLWQGRFVDSGFRDNFGNGEKGFCWKGEVEEKPALVFGQVEPYLLSCPSPAGEKENRGNRVSPLGCLKHRTGVLFLPDSPLCFILISLPVEEFRQIDVNVHLLFQQGVPEVGAFLFKNFFLREIALGSESLQKILSGLGVYVEPRGSFRCGNISVRHEQCEEILGVVFRNE